jgi:hypothetical protein
MYIPGTLKVSNMISAVNSRFSGGFSGGSVSITYDANKIVVNVPFARKEIKGGMKREQDC